jgi:hypothetical protein
VSNNLDVSIRGKTDGLRQSLGQAKNDVNKFKASVEKGGGLGAGVKEIAGAVLGFTALKELVDYGDKIADLSQRFGVSSTALQQWGNVAEENGSSLDGLAIGMGKLTIAQEKALAGDDELRQAFSDLGITLDDLKNDDTTELMKKIGKSAMGAGDMVKVMGKSALELRPALAAVADGTAELGAAMDEHLIQKLGEASDMMKRLKQTTMVVGGEIVGGLMKWGESAGIGVGKLINRLTVGAEEAKRIAEAQTREWEEKWNGVTDKPKPRVFADQSEGDVKKQQKLAEKIKKLNEEAYEVRAKASFEQLSTEEKIESVKESIRKKEEELGQASEERTAELKKETSELYTQLATLSNLKQVEDQRAMDKKVDRKLMTPAERSAADRESARRVRTERAIRRNEANAAEDAKKNGPFLKPRPPKPVADFIGPPAPPEFLGPPRNRDPRLDKPAGADVKASVDAVYDLLNDRLKFPSLGGDE